MSFNLHGSLNAMPQQKRDAIRLTVPMDPRVHAVFKRMAAAASIPVGRAIADWCRDTVEGAEFVAAKMEQARKQPKLVMREMHAAAGGLLEEIGQVQDQEAKARPGARRGGRSH